ncbi:hypothetical protein KXD40_002511 [Peronospora effusa]|nr:hypothetical protein DD238_005198 [Peronospora effusa]UIZ26416.1 hypothetical protein KXD40_002511 [Peronospora effusa]
MRPRLFPSLVAFSLLTALVVSQPDNNDNKITPDPADALSANTAAFQRADPDHNGIVDPTEFATFTSSLKQAIDPILGPLSTETATNSINSGSARTKLRTGGPHKFWSGFGSGMLTIWATEIGDKTFFIAAILSMRKDRIVVFAGAIGALIVMTVLSVIMGVVATKFLPPSVTHYLGGVLFVVFGAKMLYDAREMNAV